jgi:predicted transcriptional regulator of viral defense system
MAPVLERLELDRPDLVTTADLAAILDQVQVATPARIVAARLRKSGWLLATGQRGVWEFAPAEAAGPYSRHDPVMPLRSFLVAHPGQRVALTFQAGAWAHGLADRLPARLEVAVPDGAVSRRLPDSLSASVFEPVLPTTEVREVPVLPVESILVHMAVRPTDVRSWASAVEWLADLAAASVWDGLEAELGGRPRAVAVRAGYLLQGLRPDLADRIQASFPARSRVWFGRRGPMLRHDSGWQVADTLLPLDPRTMGAVV